VPLVAIVRNRQASFGHQLSTPTVAVPSDGAVVVCQKSALIVGKSVVVLCLGLATACRWRSHRVAVAVSMTSS
jgi:hypothetical protein